uniref:ELMO domain-containing protein n=1 Tax=Parastrongyloides trichosuri TaxID=131310 RepID=A0A0N5A173_PARTI
MHSSSSIIVKGLNPVDTRLPQSIIKGAVKLDLHISNYLIKPFKYPIDPKYISCYVQYDKSIDTVTEFLKNVTRQLELPPEDNIDSYGLMFDTGDLFLNEDRVNLLKQGFILTLTASPANYVKVLMKTLETGSDYGQDTLKALQVMERLSQDVVFLLEFESIDGIQKIVSFIEAGKYNQNGTFLSSLFNIFLILMSTLEKENEELSIIYWKNLTNKFISEVASHISGRTKLEINESLVASLNIIDCILKKCGAHQISQLQQEIPFESLIRHLEKSDKRIPIRILNLMCSLYYVAEDLLKVDILSILKDAPFRNMICKLIKQQDLSSIDTELAKPMKNLQDILRSELTAKALQKPTDDEIDVIRNMESLNPCVYPNSILYPISPSGTTVFGTEEDDISTSSFSDAYPSLLIDWNEFTDLIYKNPPGLLALETILFFDTNYPTLLKEINAENIVWQETSSWPFPIVAVHLVSILIELFSIVPPDNGAPKVLGTLKRASTFSRDSNDVMKRNDTIYFMFFTIEHPFYELFALSIRLFRRTWREMHASHEDVIKVLKVVKEQLERALECNPFSIKDYDNCLLKYSYYQMQKIWEFERFAKDQSELQSDAIRHLTPKLRIQMEELVKKNRKNEMKKGFVFIKIPKEKPGSKTASLNYILLKLDRNERFLWFHDVDNEDSTTMDMRKAKKLPIMEITSFLFEESYMEYMQSNYGRKLSMRIPSKGICLCFNGSKDPEINISSDNQIVINCWIDGLNCLINDKIITADSIVEVKKLADFDVKVRLMYIDCLPEIRECEIGSKIERKIPDLPDNFDWINVK